MCRRAVAAALSAAVLGIGIARADPPPAPPADHPPRVVREGAAFPGPALCLDVQAWTYQTELRRYYEARIRAEETVARSRGRKGFALGLSIGLAVAGTFCAADESCRQALLDWTR